MKTGPTHSLQAGITLATDGVILTTGKSIGVRHIHLTWRAQRHISHNGAIGNLIPLAILIWTLELPMIEASLRCVIPATISIAGIGPIMCNIVARIGVIGAIQVSSRSL